MTTLNLENIKCHGCARSITDALHKLEGISTATVDVETGTVKLESEEASAIQLAKETLLKMGYPELGQGGMATTAKSYVSCMIGRMK